MKIDCHIHITPPNLFDLDIDWKEEPYFLWLMESKQNKFATAEEVVSHLDEVGFDKAIVFGFAFQNPKLCRYVNDYTIEQINKFPERLIGFMVVNPNDNELEKEVGRCVNRGLVGIGELFPQGQKFDLKTIHLTSKLKSCCEKYQLPILLHTNETVGHKYPGKTDVSLEEVEAFVENHSKTPIILAHLGGGIAFFESMKKMKKKFEYVYYDTAAILFLYESNIYSIMKEIGIFHKLLFGSDYPLVAISRYWKEIQENELPNELQRQLLGESVATLLAKRGK